MRAMTTNPRIDPAQTTYRVVVRRTEEIVFELEATSAEDAVARYLSDGDETGSETTDTTVESVTG